MPLGKLSVAGECLYLVPAVERVLLALGFLLGDELAALGDSAVLGRALEIRGVRGRCGLAGRRERETKRRAPGFHTRHEALEVFLLIGGERRVRHRQPQPRAGSATAGCSRDAGPRRR